MGEKLTNINKLRNPNFLGGWDLQDANGNTVDIIVTIKEVKQSEVFSQKLNEIDLALTLYFNEVKPLVLNSGNRKTLIKVTETEFIEKMIGKKIQLTTKRIKAFGEMHDAIRIVNKKISESSVVTPTPAPVPVDEATCIEKLNECTTVVKLAEVYLAFTSQEKANENVLRTKNELKQKLDDNI